LDSDNLLAWGFIFLSITRLFLQNNPTNLATFLYIDTAGEKAMVALSKDNVLLAIESNETTNSHASFVQVAIDKMIKQQDIALHSMDAIVVTMGPGSYTGLRVGLATAKGIAYAMNKPLIGISTLALLAIHAINHIGLVQTEKDIQIFSMIDAKRMEVFGAIYKADLSVILPEQAIVLDQGFLIKLLENGPTLCVGNGATKTSQLYATSQLYCIEAQYDINDFMELALEKWTNKHFENTAYSSPSYLKEFHQGPTKTTK
jgi:tRNA threonylcarbamoyladenosine biosynthesis protein TsaB